MSTNDPLRSQLSKYLDWHDAHAGFDQAVAGIPAESRGQRPAGLSHSLWELLEHIRITQRDILEFCLPGNYTELQWPADYWPPAAEPPSADAWDASIAGVRADRAEFQNLVADPNVDLFSLVPHGADEQTYAREVLLVVDHGAYHIGQLVATRMLLGIWPGS
jgi:uncharacterized damage-inducible protein DinB